MTIRVLLADDHPVVRSGIRAEISYSTDIQVVAEATTGPETLQLTSQHRPDVVLLDINMPDLRAVHAIRELGTLSPVPKVLVITASNDVETIQGMIRAGAAGYFVKDDDPANLVDAIRAVHQGQAWLSAAAVKALAEQKRGEQISFAAEELSLRELQVLRLLAQGYTNTQIAETLVIAEGTVKNHVTNLYDRIGVHSRAEAVTWAWKHGLLKAG